MPIQHALWKVGDKPQPLEAAKLPSEQLLENMILAAPEILSQEWMFIGRQETTGFSGRIDLLAIAPDGSLVLVEIKRDRTPREVVAQALDYASWVEGLTADRIAQIHQRFSNGGSLSEDFRQRFGAELDEETLNQSHQIIIVAAALDDSTERIINYLNARGIAINVVFFQVFQHGGEQLLSRVWLIDPTQTQTHAATATPAAKSEKEPWNGEYYVSFGSGQNRSWEEARKYGFISAGGGAWYSRTLKLLSPGDRVWVKDPGFGYIGVGEVVEPAVPVSEFEVTDNGTVKPALDVLRTADILRQSAGDPQQTEYFVKVKWQETVSARDAFNEVGLFGNQNTVCQPTTPKWRHTVERLKTFFKDWNGRS